MRSQRGLLLAMIGFPLFAFYSSSVLAKSPSRLTQLKAAALSGSASAELQYGKALAESGDIAEAKTWLKKAAVQGKPASAEAWYQLGQNETDDAAGLEDNEKAALAGYADSFDAVFDGLIFRAGPDADVTQAKKFADLARKRKIDLGYDGPDELQTIDRCFEAGNPTVPESDEPNPSEKSRFPSSVTCAIYHLGLGVPKDDRQYRNCVFTQGDNNSIAELYANGWGVTKNLKLAIALVCHGSSVPAELTGMVQTLESMRNGSAAGKDFLFCDYVTSGMNGGKCSSEGAAIEKIRRDLATRSLTEHWTTAQKAAFQGLERAADAYFEEHSGSELDMSGTASAGISIDEEEKLKAEFMKNLHAFEAGHLPKDGDFKSADQALNAAYQKLMKKKWSAEEDGTVGADGIRETQRKWIRYRDAWAKFGPIRYPQVPAETWKTWVTQQRIKILKSLFSP